MISKEAARKQLLIGYIFAAIGFVIGASSEIYTNPIISMLIFSYIFWSIYWGYLEVSKPITEFFGNMYIIENSMLNLFIAHIRKIIIIKIIIIVTGLIIGSIGIAIYKQISLSKIAYN